ncbi:MAG: co-chaperone DjlA [Legionella sp.]|nr:co-chaperone DjlA [Legionella sp.]
MNFRQFFTTNTWWGKLLGCFFGYLMAGSAGALLGILIGNFFDRGLANHFSRPYWSYHDEKREAVQKIFFEATFAIMGYIAKSDGRVSENEIQMARVMMDEMRLSRQHKTLAKHYFNEGKSPAYNIDRMLTLLKSSCYDNPDLLKVFMDIQYRSAQVDGLSAAKFQALDDIFKRLGFAPLHQQYRFYEDFGFRRGSSSKQQSSGSSNNYSSVPPNALAQSYALLEVAQTATKQEVKRAYRRSISRNHPDKLIAQGLPEEMIKAANDRTQKITKAYEQICESKGW